MTVQALDPFGYWPAQRSRIRSLGGPERSTDANYVFHSAYVAVPAGPALAEIAFDDLVATVGMIAVRIFQHLPDGQPPVTERGKITALLPSLAATPRSIKLPFDAVPGATYAVTGYVFGECEAQARGLSITVSARVAELDDPARTRSLFGRLKARRAGAMVSSDTPQLAWPVSQGFTSDQIHEPDYARLSAQLPAGASPVEAWEAAYILRVLEQYGRLAAGARGLALSAGAEPVARIATEAGCNVQSVFVAPGATTEAACSAHFSTPGEGVGFDFIYTRSDLFGSADAGRAAKMIDDLLGRVRPGGLVILLANTGPNLDRHGLNRIVLEIAALGHIAAQVRHADLERAPGPFGIVVRASTEAAIA